MPKTYITEIIGYAFSELSEEVKKKHYDHEYEDYATMADFSIIETLFRKSFSSEWMTNDGYDTLELFYDLSYSQGSGACCVAELDNKKVLDSLGSYWDRLVSMIKKELVTIDDINVVRCGASNHYVHENTCRVTIDYSCNDMMEDQIRDEINKVEIFLTEEIRHQLTSFHDELQDYYEEAVSFESYCSSFNEEVVFTKEGKIVDPVFIKSACIIDGYQLQLDFDNDEDNNPLHRRDMSKDRQTYI